MMEPHYEMGEILLLLVAMMVENKAVVKRLTEPKPTV